LGRQYWEGIPSNIEATQLPKPAKPINADLCSWQTPDTEYGAVAKLPGTPSTGTQEMAGMLPEEISGAGATSIQRLWLLS